MGPVQLTPIAVYDPDKEGKKLLGVFNSMATASMFIYDVNDGKNILSKLSSKNRIGKGYLPVDVVVRHANAEQVKQLSDNLFYLEDESYVKYTTRISRVARSKHIK